ncbi:MAG: FAD-dependent thymidylate synthase [Verrucomicrobiae bacterium]|nr:FAD-dependent thymidylate synthase [Verrucomicrobiae bacterium]
MNTPHSFLSPSPVATLVNSFSLPFANAVAAARTCYSAKGIVDAGETAKWSRRDDLARSIYQAGHHTVYQHAHFQFALSNVSRQFVWSFLHSHPYYNSEQVSQRYVEVQPGTVIVPKLEGNPLSIYQKTVEAQFAAYHQLGETLLEPVRAAYFDRFKNRAGQAEDKKIQEDIKKRCMEAARYALPIGAFTQLYHTINGITLLRYHRLCRQYDAPTEQAAVAGLMVEELLKQAPEYRIILEDPLPLEETPEHRFFHKAGHVPDDRAFREFAHEFDVDLDGRISLLIDHKVDNEGLLANAVREVLGVPRTEIDDDTAIAMALDPAANPLLGETLNLTTLDKITRALAHPSYTFRKKISHTADSQNQRHRATPASRPCLRAYLSNNPDYITPAIIASHPKSLEIYRKTMERSWEGIRQLRKAGVPDEFVCYLLPNAVSLRFTESADLLNLRHKCAMRLCLNAQEEIWRASREEVQQIQQINPRIARYLLPPCGLRSLAHASPPCPEGGRFCGVPAWKTGLNEITRLI